MRKFLVTGGCGFIGTNFIKFVLSNYPDIHITNLDALTYAGNLENLLDVENSPRYRFVKGNVCDKNLVEHLMSENKFDVVINFAAESHVDRSLYYADLFLKTNVFGTYVLLESFRKFPGDLFVQISTDEVYGSIDEGSFVETSPLNPSSPYAASKASADLLVMSYYTTFNLPVMILRSSNNYGPYQYPEKVIPLFIANALEDKPLPLYADGSNIRDWLFVEDNCRGIMLAIEKGRIGQIYNFGGECQITNLELTKKLLRLLNKPESLIRFVKDRPGHDKRYAMNISKARGELGWRPLMNFDEGLKFTINWYIINTVWIEHIRQKSQYREFYNLHYKNR